MNHFTLASQVSTSHSAREDLSVASVRKAVQDAQDIIPSSIIITGAREMPEIFNELFQMRAANDSEVYIWYNLLSDYPGQAPAESVVNYRGETSAGWQGWGSSGNVQVEESFVFSCPNNPGARRKTLAGMEYLLREYPFDGVFLDKFRFPSPAVGGLEMVFSCFCPYCQNKARSQGLDLDEVRSELMHWSPSDLVDVRPHENLFDALIKNKPALKKFRQFRIASIYELVEDVRKLTTTLGRRLGLDLFTPLFAPLVGQDYKALRALADWAKPMIYRFTFGPAGYRLEAKSLVDDLQKIFGLPLESILDWVGQYYPDVNRHNYDQMVAQSTPLSWIRHEMQQAIPLFNPKPVYMGLETVSFPDIIEVTPAQVREMMKLGIESGVQGAVVSWDLLNTPLENIVAIRDSL